MANFLDILYICIRLKIYQNTRLLNCFCYNTLLKATFILWWWCCSCWCPE